MRVVMAYGGVDGDDEMMMVAVVLVVVVEVAARGGGDRVDRVKRNLFGFSRKSPPEKFSGGGGVVVALVGGGGLGNPAAGGWMPEMGREKRASVSVMPLLTYLNLGLGELAHIRLTVELADRTVKYPKGIAENVLVGIGTFPVDFIILDMLEDIKVPLILGRPFLSTARAKIDVYKGRLL
ncbi:putative reverse transcriptase domain-containing protein [Tanacetum coccineum]